MGWVHLPGCAVDLVARTVHRADGGRVGLTEQEAALLAHLAARVGEPVPRSELLERVLGYAPTSRSRAVDHAVTRLRSKLEGGRPCIVSVHGVGYRLVVQAPPAVARDRFVGREGELARISGWLDRDRLVMVHGLPGIGKSRLSAEVSARIRPSEDAVRLAVSAGWSAGSLACEVARLLALPEARREPLLRVGRALAVRGRMLLVVDDAHLAPRAVEEALTGWLELAPGLVVLVVARPRLALPGAVTLPLGPLDGPEAAALLTARATEADASLRVDPDAVRRCVAALDGVPASIEAAAGVLATAPIESVLDRVEDVLATPAVRHPILTVLASVSGRASTAWRRLAVFPGPFDLAAGEAVAGPDESVAGAIGELVDAGLVFRLPDGRYQLLAPARVAARRAGGPDAEARRRHARWFARWGSAEAVRALQSGGRQGPRREHLPDLSAAARTALELGEPETAAACLAALPEIPVPVPVELVTAVLAVARPDDVARLRWMAAVASFESGNPREGEEGLKRAVELARAQGDGVTEARAEGWLGVVLSRRGAMDEALRVLERAQDLARREGLDRTEAAARGNAAWVLHGLGRLAEARETYAVCLALFERAGHTHALAATLVNLALVCRDLGDLERARAHFERAAALFAERGDHGGYGGACANLAKLEVLAGRPAEASAWIERAWNAARGLGVPHLEASLHSARARVEEAAGHPDEALGASALEIAVLDGAGERADAAIARLRRSRMMERSGHPDAERALGEACREIEATGQPDALAVGLARYGELLRRRGELLAARSHADRALSWLGAQAPISVVAEVRAYVACLEAEDGDVEAARRSVAEAERVARSRPSDVDLAEALASARSALHRSDGRR